MSKDVQREPIVVEVGAGWPVVVSKVYGPLVAADVCVHLDYQAGEWVVEIKRYASDDDLDPKWLEMARFHCDPDGKIPL